MRPLEISSLLLLLVVLFLSLFTTGQRTSYANCYRTAGNFPGCTVDLRGQPLADLSSLSRVLSCVLLCMVQSKMAGMALGDVEDRGLVAGYGDG